MNVVTIDERIEVAPVASKGRLLSARVRLAGAIAAVVAPIVFLLSGGVAGATTYDPTSDATSLATGVGTTAGPVIVAVATALVGLVILLWAVRFVYGLLRGGRS